MSKKKEKDGIILVSTFNPIFKKMREAHLKMAEFTNTKLENKDYEPAYLIDYAMRFYTIVCIETMKRKSKKENS